MNVKQDDSIELLAWVYVHNLVCLFMRLLRARAPPSLPTFASNLSNISRNTGARARANTNG